MKYNTKIKKVEAVTTVLSPLDERLEPERRMEITLELSELMMRIITYVICYTLVNHQDLLKKERMSIAHAFLQRVMTMHLCNHKLTKEGLVYEYKGEPFVLQEGYRTMTLTRSVYEHLAMYYFVFEHPKTEEESNQVWENWKKDNWRDLIPFNQAWKYLFNNSEMASFYRNLSMHCHPAYKGLVQYQHQGASAGGYDGIALYFSSRFLAHLCRMFLKQIPDGWEVLRQEFSEEDLYLFKALSQMPKDK